MPRTESPGYGYDRGRSVVFKGGKREEGLLIILRGVNPSGKNIKNERLLRHFEGGREMPFIKHKARN